MRTEEEIRRICTENGIKDYSIESDGSVNVNGAIAMTYEDLEELPLDFGVVTGDFICHNNLLTTLKGSPHTVGGDFSCSHNQLTSLEGGPEYVGGSFACKDNNLYNLEGSPRTVDYGFECSENDLNSLAGCSTEIGASLISRHNHIRNLDGLDAKIAGKLILDRTPIESIFNDVQQDFIDAFKIYKVIKGRTVNLKRLKYVMGLFDKHINLQRIERHYKVV